ncbi:RraA family protein [Candidatus Poribacteria bacterium]|nr:RraA family protein [Candidatus Poribacteria bacterium]
MGAIGPEVLQKLRTFDTPTICNLIELFDVRPRNTGYMDGRIRACFPEMPPMVGFAATATFRSSAPPRSGDAYSGTDTQVERFGDLSGPPVVVFQDLDDPAVAATFGEVMCTTYQAFGSVGIVTSGAGRDLDQVRDIGFPAFTGGTICSHAYCHILQVHVPIHVGGIAVYPDDLLHGDVNGITTIPHDIASELADIGDEFIAAEGVILEALKSGNPSPDVLRKARQESGARIGKLREQVTRAR